MHLHHHRQAVEGEDRRAEGVWRRSDRLPDRRRSGGSRGRTTRCRHGWRGRSRTRGRPTSTTTCRTRGALRADGAGDLGADRRPRHAPGVGVGTGGTISGIGRYLKERNPAIKVWGIDTYGSVFKKYKDTGIFDKNEIYPYITEGIGEDFLPANVDFAIIDHFEKVTDKDAAIMTRRLAREEGIWVGNSAGAAMAGVVQLADALRPDDVVVVIFHDHGSRYSAKMFNDEWMRAKGFLEVIGHDRARSRGARRVGRALHRRGGAAGRRGDPGHERPRLLADLRDQRRPHRRLAERGAPLRASSSAIPASSASRSRRSCSRRFRSWTSQRRWSCCRR